MPKRILNGKVVKKSGDKTVSVLVTRQTTHPIYKKIMRLYEDFSRNLFKDMFGDIVQNSKNWEKFKLLKKASFEKGDRSKN